MSVDRSSIDGYAVIRQLDLALVNTGRLSVVFSGNHLRAADGFMWEVPAGSMIIRYTAVIKDGTWWEVGDLIRLAQLPR